MASRPHRDSDAELDAIVLDAVRYNRYRGATPGDMKGYVGSRHKGETTEKALSAALGRLESANRVVRVGERWLLHPDVFRKAKGHARKPEFQFEDTWILMCILVLRKDGSCTLEEVMPVADAINKAIPTVDELHGALNRLLAARLITTRKGAYAPTPKSLDLLEKVKANCRAGLWDQMDGLTNMLKCPCCGVQLKRVTWRISVTEEEVAAAYKQYSSTFSLRRRKKRK